MPICSVFKFSEKLQQKGTVGFKNRTKLPTF